MHSVMLHEVLFECISVVCWECWWSCGGAWLDRGLGQPKRHVMAAGTYGPNGQLIFDKDVIILVCTSSKR